MCSLIIINIVLLFAYFDAMYILINIDNLPENKSSRSARLIV